MLLALPSGVAAIPVLVFCNSAAPNAAYRMVLHKSCPAACLSPVMLLTELSCTSPVMLLAAHLQELWHVHQAMLQVVFSPSYLLALLAAVFRHGKSQLVCCVPGLAVNKSGMFLQ